MDIDRVWLVTGAASGFGYAISRAVAAAGGRVVATARNPARAQSLRELAAAHPGRVLVTPLDVTDDEQATPPLRLPLGLDAVTAIRAEPTSQLAALDDNDTTVGT
ncbi:SDR family NAD(P)-dependent oxidoreductase [Nocardia sp. NBC_00565]|uniref:SDR family NAD(P)-dependent oxidoreductase n=1 Tax=Nocardia sp. NBC_00565 TaxID=2975993 RepID=UPI002E7FEC9D|nr:SDR family NAD(P)-dependent oxidoreductase [Nocardia sp. NBC_00565]WUC05972.1 SDR family NAD(P)-dependent oxidoreductase [Nocardia sp. NBC_00565]